MDKKVLVNQIDSTLSGLTFDIFGEKCGLSTFLFHGIYQNKKEIASECIFPQELVTIEEFRNFLDYFLKEGYIFISPEDILSGNLTPGKNYGLITLDDGYFNNWLLLPVLKEYKVPAVFFVPTAFIIGGEKIWSDIIYCERKKTGGSEIAIFNEIMFVKTLRVAKIKDYISQEFGQAAFKPMNDIDRPMSIEEFKNFAGQPFVHIGNHTHNHEVLGNLTEIEIEDEITVSQNLIKEITGIQPDFISYPYGSYSSKVIYVAKRHNFKLGITTLQKKNYTPLEADKLLLLNRFNPVVTNGGINYKNLRSPFQFKTLIKQWLQ